MSFGISLGIPVICCMLYLVINPVISTKCILYHISMLYIYIIEGSLEVKLPTIWADEKQRWEESERREE